MDNIDNNTSRKPKHTDPLLVQYYLDKDLPVADIAKVLSMSRQSVYGLIRRNNLKRSKSDKSSIAVWLGLRDRILHELSLKGIKDLTPMQLLTASAICEDKLIKNRALGLGVTDIMGEYNGLQELKLLVLKRLRGGVGEGGDDLSVSLQTTVCPDSQNKKEEETLNNQAVEAEIISEASVNEDGGKDE
jgi:predicted DNA-binding protein YlxM (UPF0122 family)